MKKHISLFSLLIISLFILTPISAKLKLPAIIGNNMVLKQKGSVPLWGWEQADAIITIVTSWDNKRYTTVADADGYWKVFVITPKAGGPYQIEIKGEDEIQLNNVLIGEVWLSSGQSNMEWTLRRDKDFSEALKTVDNSQIRLFKVGRQVSETPQTDFVEDCSWKESTKESAEAFSAMTYYFGVNLYKKLNVPIGLINASWGGTGIEAWLSDSVIFSNEVLQQPAERWKKWIVEYPADSANYAHERALWKQDSINGVKRKKPQEPQSVVAMKRPHRQHGVLYNGMIAPCVPYSISGMLWYQGTSNINWADEYEYQLNSLIKSYRGAFYENDLPVLVGQISTYNYAHPDKAAIVREAQLNQNKLKNVYAFCSIDLGDMKDIHPTQKIEYGNRFSYLALNNVYGFKDIAFASPVLSSVLLKEDKFILGFDHAKHLNIKGEVLKDIFISSDGISYYPADVVIKNNKLVVSSTKVKTPYSVKYAWEKTDEANLYNESNLPVFPFKYTVGDKLK